MVHQHYGEHGLGDRRGPQSYAGVVPPGGHDLDRIARDVDGLPRQLDAGGGFEGQVRDDVLTGGDAAEGPAGVVAAKALRGELVAVLAAALRGGAGAGADRTRGGPHHRLARRGAPAAAVVAHAVFLLIRVVRVSGAEAVLDLVVVPRARVGVLDQDADRRAGRVPFEHAREDAHLIGLAPLADEMRGAGAAAIDVLLQVRLTQREARRTAVDDASHGEIVRAHV